MYFLAQSIPPFIEHHLEWFVAGLIVVVGLVGFGFRDLARFSISRVWAISGVCFDESIRRRVLWITPLAILGVIIVSQLQNPTDHQDAIYQTTKFCIFATGTLLVITTIILACTNLPKEIDNRVIYTIVTKPTTRLEIVLGKILGFARVSAAILVIMGLFSLVYLKVRSMTLERDIRQRLSAGLIDPVSKPTWDHYARTGLLTSRQVANAYSLNFYARMPDPKTDIRWIAGDAVQNVLVPFDISEQDLIPLDDPTAEPGSTGLVILVKMKAERRKDVTTAPAASRPFIPTPLLASTRPWEGDPTAQRDPTVVADITDFRNEALILSSLINDGHPGLIDEKTNLVQFNIQPAGLKQLFETPFKGKKRIHVRITPLGKDLDYAAPTMPAQLIVPPMQPTGQPRRIDSAVSDFNPKQPLEASFRGRTTSGDAQQLRGSSKPTGPVAVFHFNNINVTPDSNGQVSMETKIAIERGDDEDMSDESATQMTVQVLNHKTGELSDPILLKPENRRAAYFSVPAKAMDGGSFDVVFRCVRDTHWISLSERSLGLVLQYESFALNLLKSLAILWLMSLLVITISIFCSTFVSWPIAIVLTLVILLGRWGVTQLQDSLTTGIGHEVVNTWFPGSSPPAAKAISTSVESLTRALNGLAKVLPDVDRFPATQDIDQGLSIPWTSLYEALYVIGSFALPLAVLAFVLLKYKEVAP